MISVCFFGALPRGHRAHLKPTLVIEAILDFACSFLSIGFSFIR